MYCNFAILSEKSNYTLHVSRHYKGTMGDALEYHNNSKFSAKDKDNDDDPGSCIETYGGNGWWYGRCYHQCLLIWYMTWLMADTDQHHNGIIYIMTLEI